jgi:replication factor A3
MSEATPRITAPYLEQFSHQTVRILGKVRQLRGEQATIDAGGQINVFLNRVCYRPFLHSQAYAFRRRRRSKR